MAAKPKKAPAKAKAAMKPGPRADFGAPIDGYLAKLDPNARAIFDAMIAIIASAAPSAVPALKWGMPMFTVPGGGIVCYLRNTKGYVRVGFAQGAKLDDPSGLLDGSGSGQHTKIASPSEIDKPRITKWVKACAKHVGA